MTVITLIFFTFVTYGLYRGVGLTDNFGNATNKIGIVEPSGTPVELPTGDLSIGEFASEGHEGIIVGIIMWIVVLLLTIVVVFFFETILLTGLIIFTGMLYWVFYRATRLVLRYSRLTKNNLYKSMWIGFKYSLMYSGWIYGVIWIIHLIRK